ncbi:MAG TPA: ribosomal-protein-alanine N-acetyltransferase [Acidimicrobiaceae bacterium]|nr:ribosomal-protein-alanine N-acetyltransferase [Acidimicrobiaceae bacterium]
MITVVAAQVLIRAMSAADVPAVRALDALVQPSPWSEEFLREQLVDTASRTLLVAEGPDGSQVGHAALVVLADEGHVTSIAVDPAHQRSGIGSRILAALCRDALARGLSALTLEVRASNSAAIGLYRQFGFAPAGVRPRYYVDPDGLTEDALVLWIHDMSDPVFLLAVETAGVEADGGFADRTRRSF